MTAPAPIKIVRVSEMGRAQLITLKRRTGLKQWNVLCRWALSRSFAEPSKPSIHTSPRSMVEMTWATFGGSYAGTYLAMLRVRADKEGLDPADPVAIRDLMWRHLHRGIAYLAGDKSLRHGGIAALLRLLPATPHQEDHP